MARKRKAASTKSDGDTAAVGVKKEVKTEEGPSRSKKKKKETPSKKKTPAKHATAMVDLTRYEMKFAENEVVVVLADEPDTQDRQEKYWIGRLLEDVLIGDDNEDHVKIKWFDFEAKEDEEEKKEDDPTEIIYVLEEDQVEEEPQDEEDSIDGFPEEKPPDENTTPIGSLVCAISSLLEREKGQPAHEPTRWKVTPAVYQYAERKLAQQLQDGYASETDSQFGDEAVENRLLKTQKATTKFLNKKLRSPKSAGKKAKKDDDADDDGKAKKKKKTAKKKTSKKAKKGKRGLTPRPFLSAVPDPFAEAKTGQIDTFSGDVERTGKEVIRAVRSKDHKALQAAVEATDTVFSTFYAVQSVGVPISPLVWAMVLGDVEATKILLTDLGSGNSRVSMQPCSLPTLSTGKQSSRHANYNRAAINASRGGKEGNNALLHDASGITYQTADYYLGQHNLPEHVPKLVMEMPTLCIMRDFDEIPMDVMDLCEATFSRDFHEPSTVDNMMKAGHIHMAHRFILKQTSHAFSSNAYNLLHVESLQTPESKAAAAAKKEDEQNKTEGEVKKEEKSEAGKGTGKAAASGGKKKASKVDEEKEQKDGSASKELFSKPFPTRSVAKKAETELRFSPLACACINPNPAYLEKLLQVAPEHAGLLDQRNTSLLHYAAACQGTGPIEYLFKNFSQQMNRLALDKNKEMPLHWAARAARHANVLALLEGQSEEEKKVLLAAKSAEGLMPIHYATQSRRKDNLATVRALLQAGTDANIPTSAARNKVTPVHLAARMGDMPLLKLLLDEEHKGNPSKGDKLGRTPLIHACMNGHAHIVAHLLGKVGVDPEASDSSDNTPMHYAAAYGWSSCVELLLAEDKDKAIEESELDADGDTEMKDGDSNKPRYMSIADPDPKNSWKTTPLTVSVQKGRQSISSILLELPSVDVNAPDGETGKTLFYRLVEVFIANTLLSRAKKIKDDGAEEIKNEMAWALQKLLDRPDVELNTTDPSNGYSILHLLCSQRYAGEGCEVLAVAFAKLVVSRGAKSGSVIGINTRDKEDMSALLHAAANGNKLLLEFLLEQGADIDACDKDGMTALLHTFVAGNKGLSEFLLGRGASVKADLVDKQGRNIVHHLLRGDRVQKLDCMKQLELVERSAGGEGEFATMLESADNEGYTPIHVAMKHACASRNEEDFERSHEVVKSLCARFPSTVSIPVQPIKLFTDPKMLSDIVLGKDDEGGNSNTRNHYSYRQRQNPTPRGVLSSTDRVDPKKIRASLKSTDAIVPLASEDVGKTLLHFACDLPFIDRLADMMKWLLPVAPEAAKLTMIRKNKPQLTPAQILLREKLTTGFGRSKPLKDSNEEQKIRLGMVLDAIRDLLAASGSSMNDKIHEPTLAKTESAKQIPPYTAEIDKEKTEDLKRLALAFTKKTDDCEAGSKVVDAFKKMMEARQRRSKPNGGAAKLDETYSVPFAIFFAKAETRTIPTYCWDRLIDEFGLVLDESSKGLDSALVVALARRDTALVTYLCARCPRLMFQSNPSSGEYPIHLAARMNDSIFLKLLLNCLVAKSNTKEEALAAINRHNKGGHTALHLSVQEDSPSHVTLLVEALRANAKDEEDVATVINQCDNAGRTALHLSVAQAARRSGQPLHPCERMLLKAGARIVAKDKNQRTPLHYCFLDSSGGNSLFNFPHDLSTGCHDRIDLVSTLLGAAASQTEEGGMADFVNQPDRWGRTALFYAAAFNSTVSSLLLCNSGARLFHTDKDGNTPINIAVLRGHDNYAITLLKSKGSSSNLPELVDVAVVHRSRIPKPKKEGKFIIKVTSRSKKTIMWHAINRGFRGLVYILLESFPLSRAVVDAIDNGAFELVRKLLTESPPQVLQYINPENGRTLLHEVADVRHYSDPEWSTTMAELLLESGVSTTSVTKDGRTSLHLAAFRGHFKLAQLLVEKGAPVAAAAGDGLTCLHSAATRGDFGLAQLLVANGAPVAAALKEDGRTSLHSAACQGNLRLAELLVEHGAPVAAAFNETGETCLHIAASRGDLRMARFLVGKGAPVAAILTKVDEKEMEKRAGWTSLHIAASRCNLDLVKLMADQSSPASKTKDEDGYLPLAYFMRALPRSRPSDLDCLKMLEGLTLGIQGLGEQDINVVPRNKTDKCSVIEYKGAPFHTGPNIDTVRSDVATAAAAAATAKRRDTTAPIEPVGCSTLVIQAIRVDRLGLAQALINKGARVDQVDSEGMTPLHHAVSLLVVPAVVLLLRNGADPNIPTGGSRPLTPLLMVTFLHLDERKSDKNREDAFEIARILLRWGADALQACQETGNTILHFAVKENNRRVANLVTNALLRPQGKKKANACNGPKKKGDYLVRFGSEPTLYPAQADEKSLKVFSPAVASNLPPHLVSEWFDCGDLALNSLSRLVELSAGSSKTEDEDAKDDNMDDPGSNKKPEQRGVFLSSTKSPEGELFAESDEDSEEEFGSAPGTESNQDVRVRSPGGFVASRYTTNSPDVVCDISGKHLSKGSVAFVCSKTGWKAGLECARVLGARQARLEKYYGLESLIVGDKDPNLTTPITVGAAVLVQVPEGSQGRHFANAMEPWFEGRISAAYSNGTYEVDLIRGTPLKDVLRQQIRPWTSTLDEGFDDTLGALFTAANKEGQTPLQCAVKAFKFGSFESKELVDLLIDAGAAVDASVVSLARPGSSFRAHLVDKMEGSVMEEDTPTEVVEAPPLPNLEPLSSAAFEAHTTAALIELEKKGLMKLKDSAPKINKMCQIQAVGLHVVPVADQNAERTPKSPRFYDFVGVKVELTHYGGSENMYYKMQIVRDPGKDLFVLITNWGQVGDYGGQKQETPMGNREEAIKEFQKIVKAKTGNLWEDFGTERFQPVLGRYRPVAVLSSEYKKPELADIVAMVDNEKDYPKVQRKSSLPPALSEAVRSFAASSAISAAACSLGFHQDSLPLGKLSIQNILEAEEKLATVESALNEVTKFTKPDQVGDRRAALEKVAIVSSEFFSLIPTREGDQALLPLNMNSLKDQRTKLFALRDLTVASQVMNTASAHSQTENPIDYAYRALNTNMAVLGPSDVRTGIEQYFRNTCGDNDLVVNEVFAVNRLDEPSNRHMENHRLLWHGTSIINMIGIIKEGLRVAPPTAQKTGAAFGEGVYFADQASKSWGYCRANFSSSAQKKPRAYLLLADVALGTQEKVTTSMYDRSDVKYGKGDTVMAVGQEGPDTNLDVTFSASGTAIPLGKSVRNPAVSSKVKWVVQPNNKEMGAAISDSIETVRNSKGTIFPAKVRVDYDSKPWDVSLQQGPFANTAKATAPNNKRTQKQSEKAKKKQRVNEQGDAAETLAGNADEKPSAERPRALRLVRREQSANSNIHYNEYIVDDTSRINIKYIVEVTSRSWLTRKFKEELETQKQRLRKTMEELLPTINDLLSTTLKQFTQLLSEKGFDSSVLEQWKGFIDATWTNAIKKQQETRRAEANVEVGKADDNDDDEEEEEEEDVKSRPSSH